MDEKTFYTYDRVGNAGDNFRLRELITGFDNDLHNEKSHDYDAIDKGREALDKLIGILRKNKWTTKDFILFLYKKWYPHRENR